MLREPDTNVDHGFELPGEPGSAPASVLSTFVEGSRAGRRHPAWAGEESNTTVSVAVSKKTRFEVFKRDSFKCQYCGSSAPDVILEVDHIKPKSKGGKNDLFNLVTSCKACNRGKGAKTLDDSSAVQKQKRQLDELNEKRIQTEMLLEWREQLATLEEEHVDLISRKIDDALIAYNKTISDVGKKSVARWIRRFGINNVLDAIRSASEQADNAEKLFDLIGKIAHVNKRAERQPWLKRAYYIRGILNKRLDYVNDWMCIKVIEDASIAGVPIDEIEELSKEVRSWTHFKETLEEMHAYKWD